MNTTKDLSVSPLFSIAVWEEETLDTDSATDIFTIAKAVAGTSSSSTAQSSTASATTPPIFTSSSSSTTSSTPPPTTDQPAATSSSLSTGAAVGVGVGATVAALSLLAGGWFLGRRCVLRKQRGAGAGMERGGVPPEELPVEYVPPDKYTSHLSPPGAEGRAELSAGMERVEAPVDDRPHELEVPDGWARRMR